MINLLWLRQRRNLLRATVGSLTPAKVYNIAKSTACFFLRSSKSGPAPVLMTLILTYRCNYSCIMCKKSSIDDKGHYEDPGDMEFDDLEALLHSVARYVSVVRITGGEPLLFKDIYRLIDLFDELGLKYTILTNGSLLTPEVGKRLMKNCIGISISIDSPDPENYKAIRVNGSLDRVVANVENINRLKKESGSRMPDLNLAATTFSFNVSDMPALVEFAADHGFATMSINEGWDLNTPGVGHDHLMASHVGQWVEHIEQAQRIAKELGIVLKLYMHNLRSKDPASRPRKVKSLTRCFDFYTNVRVHPRQEVSLCCFASIVPGAPTAELKQLWNDPRSLFVKGRELLRDGRFPDMCKYCAALERTRCDSARRASVDVIRDGTT